MNLSTLALYEDDAKAHDYAPWADILERLRAAGFVTVSHTAEWLIDPAYGPIDVGIFSLTPLGRDAAQSYYKKRIERSLWERFHGLNWTTWGGISAVVAMVASIISVILSYWALKQ